MFEKLGAFMNLFRKGEEINDPEKWKQGGITAGAVGAFLLALDGVLRIYGINVPLSPDQAEHIAAGIIALVGVVLPAITSSRAGLLPPKPQQPDSPSDSGVPEVEDKIEPS